MTTRLLSSLICVPALLTAGLSNASAASLALQSKGILDGQLVLDATGPAGKAVRVESSADLANWIPVRPVSLDGGTNTVPVPMGEAVSRSYRLREARPEETPAPLAVPATRNGDFRRSVMVDRTTPGTISLTDDDGIVYELDLPAGCFLAGEEVTLHVIRSVQDWPLAGAWRAGVVIEPIGRRLLAGATLRIRIPDGTPPGAPAVAWDEGGADFHAVPARIEGRTLVIPIDRLGGYGAVAGNAVDRSVFEAHPPASPEAQAAQALALALLTDGGAGLHAVADGRHPAALSPKQQAAIEQNFNERIRPRLADAAHDDAALEPALYGFSGWIGSLDVLLSPEDLAALQPLIAQGNALAVNAIEASIFRASRVCERHDLRSLARLVRAGQLFEVEPWAPTVPQVEKDLVRQRVKNCATFDLDLDAVVDSTSKAGTQHSRVHWHWTIDFKDVALTQLTGSGPVPLSEVDYQSATACNIAWSPKDGGALIPEFSLGPNLAGTATLSTAPKPASFQLLFSPFLVPPTEGYQATCPGASVPLGEYWTAAFGRAYEGRIVRNKYGQIIRLTDWSPGSGDVLGTQEKTLTSIQVSGFTAKVRARWELRHVPVPF